MNCIIGNSRCTDFRRLQDAIHDLVRARKEPIEKAAKEVLLKLKKLNYIGITNLGCQQVVDNYFLEISRWGWRNPAAFSAGLAAMDPSKTEMVKQMRKLATQFIDVAKKTIGDTGGVIQDDDDDTVGDEEPRLAERVPYGGGYGYNFKGQLIYDEND